MPYEKFKSNISNAVQLLEVAKIVDEPNSKQLLIRSTVVLCVAYWQNFNETLVLEYAKSIQKRAKSSKNLPKPVRDEIGKWINRKNNFEKNPEKAAKIIWEYADGIWKRHYGEFVEEIIVKLNTPNSKKLNELYNSALGINNISNSWDPQKTVSTNAIDDILDIRHEIAHGTQTKILTADEVENHIKKISDIAEVTYKTATAEYIKILGVTGNHYKLNDFGLKNLIKWISEKEKPFLFKPSDLSKIDPSWYGNYKKLTYQAWALIENDGKNRRPTEKFYKFIAGELAIPFEIVSFGGKDTIPAPGTEMVFFKEL
jgi:hypothetical protein